VAVTGERGLRKQALFFSGEFSWRCEHGRVAGSALLAPIHPARIQSIKLARKEL
jgi:hypothetical protein